MTPKTLFLIDGHALAYRAYYALIRAGLKTVDGIPTGAVTGFMNILLALIEKEKPQLLAVSFDRPTPTFRHEAFEAYKAHRKPTPEDMKPQLPLIKDVLKALDVPIYELDGYEADDVIATTAKKAAAAGYQVVIVTGDMDILQVVGGPIRALMPQKGSNDFKYFGPEEVKEKYGLTPEQIVDYKAICGDTSDNIPGVPGVGEKGALKLIEEFGTLENILANLDKIANTRARNAIQHNVELAKQSQFLATIHTDVPVDLDFEACHITHPHWDKLNEILLKLELHNIKRRIPVVLRELGMVIADDVEAHAPAAKKVHEALPHHVINTETELNNLLERLAAHKRFAVDLETTSLDPFRAEIVGIGLAYSGEVGYYIPVGHLDLEKSKFLDKKQKLEGGLFSEVLVLREDQLPRELVLLKLKPLLEDESHLKIAHNAKYERMVFKHNGIQMKNVAFDTMVASYVLNPVRKSHGLKELSKEICNYEMTPITELIGSGAKMITMDRVEIEKAAPYGAADAAITYRLYEHFLDELSAVSGQPSASVDSKPETRNLKTLFDEIEMPLVEVLADMEETGVCIDRAYLKELSKEFSERLKRLEEGIYADVGQTFNINSPQQLAFILFDKLQLPVQKKTATGLSTDVSVLEALRPAHPCIEKILEYRSLAKLKSTYIDALPALIDEKTGRVHTSYNQAVTATGRLSSSDPNLQNIPIKTEEGRKIRQAFIPQNPDNWILSADYSQVELRILAHICQDPGFMKAFLGDQDIHAATAADIFNVPLPYVTADMRRKAKTINFAIVYGAGEFNISQNLGISRIEAREIIDRFFTVYSGIKTYMEKTEAEAFEKGYVTTLLGRRREIPDIRSTNRNVKAAAVRTAINTPIQGTAADIIKIAMVDLHQALRAGDPAGRPYKSKMIMQVHDELVFEVEASELEPIKVLVKEKMEGAYPMAVPLKVDMAVGKSWLLKE